MTLSQYTLMHRRARLSASDVLTLCSWTGQVAGAQEGEHFLETEDSTVYTRHQLRRMRERELAEMLGPGVSSSNRRCCSGSMLSHRWDAQYG
jgi:hypothetical protein